MLLSYRSVTHLFLTFFTAVWINYFTDLEILSILNGLSLCRIELDEKNNWRIFVDWLETEVKLKDLQFLDTPNKITMIGWKLWLFPN